MAVSVNELNGFDFSEKYLKIHEKFSIIKNGKQVDFKIFKRENFPNPGKYELLIEFKYVNDIGLIKKSKSYENPFLIFREVERDIVKEDTVIENKTVIIKNTLKEFNPDFDKWADLTKKLSSNIDILKLFPKYKSSKIPQNLSKDDLANYLDNFSKFELEKFFANISILDFEIFYQNTHGEDYEYLIEKAFTSLILGEKLFNREIYELINKKRRKFYFETILKNNGFNYNKYDSMVPVIDFIVNYNSCLNSKNIATLSYQKLIKDDRFDIKSMEYKNIERLLHKLNFQEVNNTTSAKRIDFNNLDDCLTKSKYVFILKAISSTSNSPIVMRYKIPKENMDDDSVQTVALNNGHIKFDNAKNYLSEYTVNQLKCVLKKYGLAVGGNKIHLINRIKENLSDDIINKEFTKKYFTLTNSGQEFLDTYYYLAEFYNVIPPNFTIDEFDLICKSNPDINPDDIIKCLIEEEWIIWDEKLGEKPNINDNKEKLDGIFENRKNEDNFYRTSYDSVILV